MFSDEIKGEGSRTECRTQEVAGGVVNDNKYKEEMTLDNGELLRILRVLQF